MQVKEKSSKSSNGQSNGQSNGNGHGYSALKQAFDGAVIATPLASPLSLTNRADHRKMCAIFWEDYPKPPHDSNGDEAYSDRRGNFSKGMHHKDNGLVEPGDYQKLVNAITSGDPLDFDAIPIATLPALARPYVNPQAGLAVEMIGADPEHLAIAPAPKFNSITNVAEIVENYWMALLRDVNFADYQSNPLVQTAVNDFEKKNAALRQALFPQDAANAAQPLTNDSLFRGVFVGEQAGPYISQFLLQDCFIGAQPVDQKMRTVMPGMDYMTSYAKWLEVQRGFKQPGDSFDPVHRHIRNGRDLGQWVHVDQLYQAYLLACLQLLDGKAKLSDSNPYNAPGNQQGFATFGGAHILSLVTEVATRALKAVWYQKWAVHRRLRPEAFAGRIQVKYLGDSTGQMTDFDIDSAIEHADVLSHLYSANGNFLLPMAFPEGSPMHPAYGAGHATVAGACTTILKAWFKGSEKFSTMHHPHQNHLLVPMQASMDGLSLTPYTGADAADLTIEGELNKLAGNIAIGRNFAGVHWRSDYRESLLLGEKVAISSLMDYVGSFNEANVKFEFRSFTGHDVVVGNHEVLIDGNQVIQQAVPFCDELSVLNQVGQ